MNILVTGGAGFIGASICRHLKEHYPQYAVTAFDNLRRRGSELNLPDLRRRGIHFHHGDIRNADDLATIPGFDLMVEASAEPSVLAGLDSHPGYVIDNNLNGAVHCFHACLRHRARLIFLSTSRVYPIERIENAAFVEQDTRFAFAPLQTEPGISADGISELLNLDGFRSFYGATKLAAELLIREYGAFYQLPYAISRFGVVAGPGQLGKTDQGVVT
jgi:CDP-paratose 2-epimerase